MQLYPFRFYVGDRVRVRDGERIIGGREGTIIALEINARSMLAAVKMDDGQKFRCPQGLLIEVPKK